MLRPWRFYEEWLWYSVRRAALDEDLNSVRSEFTGRVLEAGARRGSGRRGKFVPPFEKARWWYTFDIRRDFADVCSDAQFLPFRAACADTFVLLEVLEYIPNPGQALAEARRVLVPGGVLLVSVPFVHRQDTPNDLWRYTPAGLTALVQKQGFVVERLLTQNAAPGSLASIWKFWLRTLSEGWRQRLLTRLSYPLAEWLLRLDRAVQPETALHSFHTGLLILARNPGEGHPNGH